MENGRFSLSFPDLLTVNTSAPAPDEDLVFYMWVHGYERDYGTKRVNWEYTERIFCMAKDAEDVVKVTNGELVEMGIYPVLSL